MKGYSSAGRAVVSKTTCREFDPYCPCQRETITWSFPFLIAIVAQLVEYVIGNDEVGGSIPLGSSNFKPVYAGFFGAQK